MTGTIITKKGIALITKLLASKQQLVFTRAAVGTGTVPAGYDPAGMVGLNQYKMDAEISGYSAEGEEATVIFQISSANVEEGFIITEAGLFAEDADDGEILYAYLSLTDDPQYVYAKNNVIQKFAEIEFRTVIGEVESMTVIMSPGALVTKEEFEIAEKKIEGIENPEFDDYSSEDVEIPDTREAIANIKSKKGIFGILSNVKAALMGLVTLGEMRGLLVNNGLCSEAGKFFLDAAFGKNLQDQLTKLNSDFDNRIGLHSRIKGFENQKVIEIKVTDPVFRYGVVLVVSSNHLSKISRRGEVYDEVNLGKNPVNVSMSDDMLIITMFSDYQHGFFIVGGSLASGEIVVHK